MTGRQGYREFLCLTGNDHVFLHQFIFALDVSFIEWDAVYRTHLLTLRLIIMANTFSAQIWVDNVDLFALRDSCVWALRFADVAINAVVGDDQGHEIRTPAEALGHDDF